MSFDLRDPAFLTNPAPALARLRDGGPLAEIRVPLIGRLWATTTDAGAREMLKDRERFSRDPTQAGLPPMDRYFWWMPGFLRPLTRNMIIRDGDDHRRLRGLVDRAFARHSIEEMRPALAAIADGLLDRIDPSRPVDIVAAYARALPLAAICELLGVLPADRPRIARWIGPLSAPQGWRSFVHALPGLWRTLRHFRADFARVRDSPRPGLIRELVAAGADGDRLSEDELLAMVFLLFAAGHETTVHLIADSVLGLTDHPQFRPLTREPERLALAVEEFVRFWSPVMMTKSHFVRADCDFHGVPLRRGERLTALLVAANHDPGRWDAPGEMRPDRRPNPHLGFGFGAHVCLGMQLARIETQVALERLFSRFPDLVLAVPRAQVAFVRRTGIRGPTRLPLRLRPAG